MKSRRRVLGLGLALAIGVSGGAPPTSGQTGLDAGPAEALLAAAERRAREGDVAGALADYERLVEQFPESPQAPEALLRFAEGQAQVGARAATLTAIGRLVTSYPGAPQAAGGLLLEGRIHATRPEGIADLEHARKTLEKIWLLFPRTYFPGLPARSAARVLDGRIALRLGREAEASTSFVEVLEMEPESPWSADAHIGLGRALIHAGEWQAAAESFQDAVAVGRASDESRALARRRLALLERRFLRTATGTRLWRRARSLTVTGIEMRRPSGIAVADDGRLLVVDSGTDLALLLAPDGSLDKRWAVRDGHHPSWGRDSVLQVAADDSVQLPGDSPKQFPGPGRERALEGIRAIERGPFGEWYVLSSRASGVLAYPSESGSGKTVAGGDGDPVDLALDTFDRLFVLEKRGRRVIRLDSKRDEPPATAVNGGWRQAAAVTVDPFGFVHVLDGGSRRVHTYNPSGEEVGAVGPVLPGGIELRKPEDIAAGGDGRLFIADSRAGLIVLE